MEKPTYICIIFRITRNYTVHKFTQRKDSKYYTPIAFAFSFADNEITLLNALP
jgi:hypothetical protein